VTRRKDHQLTWTHIHHAFRLACTLHRMAIVTSCPATSAPARNTYIHVNRLCRSRHTHKRSGGYGANQPAVKQAPGQYDECQKLRSLPQPWRRDPSIAVASCPKPEWLAVALCQHQSAKGICPRAELSSQARRAKSEIHHPNLLAASNYGMWTHQQVYLPVVAGGG
jgi:hypothetical protein